MNLGLIFDYYSLKNIQTENVSSSQLNNMDINFIDNFQIGDFSGLIIETKLKKKDIEKFDFVVNVEEDVKMQIDPMDKIKTQNNI